MQSTVPLWDYAACHTVGGGDKIGPDLLGVTQARSHLWLTRFIETPDQMLAEKDPVATALFERYKKVVMPNLRLGDQAAQDVIDFIERESSARATQQANAAASGQMRSNK